MGSSLLHYFIFLLLLWTGQASGSGEWVNHGGGLRNQRAAYGERKISTKRAHHLKLKWEFLTGASVTATPAVYKGTVYFPSTNGLLYAVDEKHGSLVWSKNITLLSGVYDPLLAQLFSGLNWTIARATPVAYKDVLLVGLYGPAYVLGLNRHTGSLLWSTQLDKARAAIVTQSGVAFAGHYYVGVSSQQEDADPELCCTFIGKFFKLSIATGAVVWRTAMLPDNGGRKGLYSGAAIWGSSPAIDVKRQVVYIATGNVYSVPPDIEACARQQESHPRFPDPCLRPENHGESVLALRLDTGAIRWARNLGPYDAWTLACFLDPPNCPAGPALDYDFGEAPMLVTVKKGTGKRGRPRYRDIVVAAQKSGIVWALDPVSGHILWETVAGPGGPLGGASWGSATDGERIYTNIANSNAVNFTLVPSTRTTTGGAWVALDALTGRVIWSVPTPNGSPAFGPVTVANGVVFVTSGSPDVYALDATTGTILWHSSVHGQEYGGFAVSNGCALVGEGRFAIFTGTHFVAAITSGTRLSAFCV